MMAGRYLNRPYLLRETEYGDIDKIGELNTGPNGTLLWTRLQISGSIKARYFLIR